ncbi:MAG: DUF1223 domain-containing protein [Rhodospirillales bacterium]
MLRAIKSLILFFALAAAPFSLAAAERPLTVVELFTSQGCSSCPPADAFLGELAGRDDVLALSFHVDYWDYIGWKDPFASADHTRRQRDYSRTLGLRYVFTPQMVIQGAAYATGSDRPAVIDRIEKNRALARIPVELREGDDGGVRLFIADTTAEGGEAADEAAVWLVVFDREHLTPIKRGENKGRKLRDYNVVRQLSRIATWRGRALDMAVTVPDMVPGGGRACAVLVQSQRTGRILGAAALGLDRPN